MGEVEVAVGCPHRLRQPIGWRTKHPCDACAPYGPPGWPRWAIALTVDYGPRLSAAATAAPRRLPPLPPPNPDVMKRIKAFTDAMTAAAEQMVETARPFVQSFIEASQGIQIDPPNLTVTGIERNHVTFQMTSTVRFHEEAVLSEARRRLRINIVD